MKVSKYIEFRLFDDFGMPKTGYSVEVSTNLMTKKYPKLIYKILREVISTALTGGSVFITGVWGLKNYNDQP